MVSGHSKSGREKRFFRRREKCDFRVVEKRRSGVRGKCVEKASPFFSVFLTCFGLSGPDAFFHAFSTRFSRLFSRRFSRRFSHALEGFFPRPRLPWPRGQVFTRWQGGNFLTTAAAAFFTNLVLAVFHRAWSRLMCALPSGQRAHASHAQFGFLARTSRQGTHSDWAQPQPHDGVFARHSRLACLLALHVATVSLFTVL